MRDFDTDIIRIITAFENITGTEVRDCILQNKLYFLVNPGKMAVAIGKEGQKIKTAERLLGRQIKVFEWAEKCEEFIKNMIPQVQKINMKGETINISVSTKDRGIVIGTGGSNINVIRNFLERNSEFKELKII